MTEADKADIALRIAEHLKAAPHPPGPLGLDPDTVIVMLELADAIRSGKKTLRKTLIALLTTAVVGLLVFGAVEKIKAMIKP